MWTEILTAVALFLVIEGLVPFLSPRAYRDAMQKALSQSDQSLRIIGLSSMIAGALLISFVR